MYISNLSNNRDLEKERKYYIKKNNYSVPSQNINIKQAATSDDDHMMSAPKEHSAHKGGHQIDTDIINEDSSNLLSNVQNKDEKLPNSSTKHRDVYQVKEKNLCDDASMSKALLPDVCDEDITEPNCSMNYLKNNNAPNSIVHNDASAG